MVLALLALAPAASAHAVLLDSVPGDGVTTQATVTEVTMAWSETIRVAFGGIKVWGPDGNRVDAGGAKADGMVVRAQVDAATPGTYAVSYRLVSGDGHPVRGVVTFSVRKKSSGTAIRKAHDASEGSRPVEVAFGIVRGIGLLATLLLAGGVAFVAAVAPGARPRWSTWMLLGAIVAALASFVLDAANSGGFGVFEVLGRATVLKAELDNVWGRASIAQAAALLLVAAWLRIVELDDVRGRIRGTLVAAPAFLPLVAWSIGGHAIATDPVAVRLPLDLLHVFAAAVWLGGLVQLSSALRLGPVPVSHVERWSRVALVAVLVLVATGLYASYVEVGLSREAFIDTAYGRIVVAKALLLLGTMPLAWFNQRHNVPGLRDRLQDPDAVRRRLRAYVRGEVLILVFVVAATAALIQSPPARTQVPPKVIDATKVLASGASVQLVIEPAQQGENSVDAYVSNGSGGADEDVVKLALVASNEAHGIDGLKLPLLPSGPGHYTVPEQEIPFAGRWTFVISVQRGTGKLERTTLSGTIAPRTPAE